MKKFFIFIVALFVTSVVSNAQVSLHLQQSIVSPGTKVMFEGTKLTDNSVTYALLSDDFASDDFTYVQVFHEQKFWDAPLYVHTEFRTYDFGYNVVYFGAAYSFFTSHGMIAVEPLYRNDSMNLYKGTPFSFNNGGFQLSIVTGHDWDIINVSSFTDLWTTGGKFGWYSEAWVYVPVSKHIQVGSILSAGYELGFYYSIFSGLKINF